MNGVKTPFGYTIIEVMIVLAVSAVMFVIAAGFINGKQEHTAFTQGVNQMASNIQDVMQQVTSGQYSDIPLSCTFNGNTSIGASGDGSSPQGTNAPCVFLGKMLYFGTGSSSFSLPTTGYQVLPVAAGRVSAGAVITDLSDADPILINGTQSPNSPNLAVDQTTPQSLDVAKITANGSTATSAIGFLQGQGSTGADNTLANGAETVGLYYYAHATNINNSFDGSSVEQAQSVDICVTDGTRYADITLGATGGQLQATVKMDGTTSCS